jgi:hypothetical protein
MNKRTNKTVSDFVKIACECASDTKINKQKINKQTRQIFHVMKANLLLKVINNKKSFDFVKIACECASAGIQAVKVIQK